jgi:hypothetical protein
MTDRIVSDPFPGIAGWLMALLFPAVYAAVEREAEAEIEAGP